MTPGDPGQAPERPRACDEVRERLTAYLDGDLDADRGTIVRGHLRGCAVCREVADREAALRDGLRGLPPLDPPPALWAAVQAQLAAAEVEAAGRPAWQRVLARWAPSFPRFVGGGLVAAAAVTVLWWRTHRDGDQPPLTAAPAVPAVPAVIDNGTTRIAPSQPAPARIARATGCQLAASADDVTADLASDPARLTACYATAADELLALATEARGRWSEDQRATFDAKVGSLRDRAARAEDGKPRQRAFRAIVSYVRGALVRDEITLASRGGP